MKLPLSVRIKLLTDKDSFEQFSPGIPSVYIAGAAKMAGRRIFIFAMEHEPGPPVDMMKSLDNGIRAAEMALEERCPLVMLIDRPGLGHSTGGKTPIPPDSSRLLADRRGTGRLYAALARLSGEAPRVSLIFGQTGAATVFPAALCDAAVMIRDSAVCIGRPDAVKHMVGEAADFEALGGARMHCAVSGLGDALADSEQDAISWARRYLAFFPANRGGRPPRIEPAPPEEPACADGRLVPADPDKPFDILPLIRRFADMNSMLELKELYAREAVTALARVEGRAVGIVANNSKNKGGILFPETCEKISRFISICDAFGIPMLFLADNPGFIIGTAAERAGIIKSASLLFTTIANAQTPRLLIVARRAHTAGLYAMSGPGFDPAQFLALPTAAISVFGRKALDRFSADRDMPPPAQAALKDMIEACSNPASLVDKGLLDAVIPVSEMRPRIAAFLDMASTIPRPDIRKQVLLV